jgi:methylated-DNA-[protein]-cysteine S-methyltransferase
MPSENIQLRSFSYVLVPSDFGSLSIVWGEDEKRPRVYRVFLPGGGTPVQDLVQMTFPGARPASCRAMAELRRRIQRFLEGDAVDFGLDAIALDRCSDFQRRVLLAEHRIPRGWVSTYGYMARILGVPGGARAVGRALSSNPFPIIIPCHRVIRSDGRLGGFQGGIEMKRHLLEFEGVRFAQDGRVFADRFYVGTAETIAG